MKTGHTIQLPEGMTMKQTADNQWEVVPVEKKLPRKWEDLESLDGWYLSGVSELKKGANYTTKGGNQNVWPTKELAAASLAMSQLMQLHKAWTNGQSGQYCVSSRVDFPMYPLCFDTREMRDDFQWTFSDLIKQASPLYE